MVRKTLFCIVLLMFLAAPSAPAMRWMPGGIHVHSTYSSGAESLPELAERAASLGLKYLVVTDHDLVIMSYGIWPLRNLIAKSYENPSVIQAGPARFLAEIDMLNSRQNDVLLIPGVQSTPHYRWEGRPYPLGELTSLDARKEILVLGLDKPEDYLGLPVIHNRRAFGQVTLLDPRLLVLAAAFGLGLFMLLAPRTFKVLGLVIMAASGALIVNAAWLAPSPYDQYHDYGPAPYQLLIDYVNLKGGLTFWAHPESNYATAGRRLGPITMRTGKYPDALLETHGYTGFEAVYADRYTMQEPGREWDIALAGYLGGQNARPAVAIAGLDYHKQTKGGTRLDELQTLVYAEARSKEAILNALSRGRAVAMRQGVETGLELKDFTAASQGETAGVGQTLAAAAPVTITISAAGLGEKETEVKGWLIRQGRVMERFVATTPFELSFTDQTGLAPGEKTYYRLNLEASGGVIVTNPIFVRGR